MINCDSCGHKNKDDLKFCPECGFKLKGPARPMDLPCVITDELKLVTILFADISGFTAMSGRLSPDEVKEILDNIFGKLTAIIESEHGKVIKYEGDCIMAAFGVDNSDESDAVRSCYAALKMQQELISFCENLKRTRGFGLSMRTGIHTGRVVVGLIGGKLDIIGDAVNIAARMEQNAGVGKIMITADMAGQLKGRFALEVLHPVRIKGKDDPVPAFNVTGRSIIKSRLILGCRTEMIGRRDELDLMVKKFEDVKKKSSPHIFYIEGPAGCGKSRLIQEFEQYVHGVSGAIKLNKSFFNSTIRNDYHVFKIFFKTLGAKCSDESELFEHLKDVMKGFDEKVLRDHSKNMSYLLGLDHVEDEYIKEIKESPKEFIPLIFKAFEDYFSATANNVSFVFLIEDLHWSDEGSIKLIDHLLRWCGAKLYFIATSRTGPKECKLNPPENKISVRRLNYLSGEQSDSMIKKIINNAAGIEKDEVDKIIGKIDSVAAGNPLFIEELIISMHERGIILKNGEKWHVDEEKLKDISLPATVETAIQSRIDGLSPENIDVLKKASAIGRKFSLEILFSILNENCLKDLAQNIEASIKKGILLPAGSDSYMFSHETIRDVAYDKLTKRQKRELHEMIALRLEGRLHENIEDENIAALICYHFDRAENKEKTVQYALAAAKKSREKYQTDDSIRHYEIVRKYLRCDGALMPEDKLIEYLEGYSAAMSQAGKSFELLDILNEFEPRLSVDLYRARLNIKKINAYIRISKLNDLQTLLNGTEELLKDHGGAEKTTPENLLRGNLYKSIGNYYKAKGSYDEAVKYFKKAKKIFVDNGSRSGAANCLGSIGLIMMEKGNYDRALNYFRRLYKIRKEIGNKRAICGCLNSIGMVYAKKGENEKALKYYERAGKIAKEIGDRVEFSNCLINMGNFYGKIGNYDLAIKYQKDAMAIKKECGDTRRVALCINNIGVSYHKMKKYDEALKFFEESLVIRNGIGDKHEIAYSLINIGTIYNSKGDFDKALHHLKRALIISEEMRYEFVKGLCLKEIGEVYARKPEYEKAINNYNRALAIFEKFDDAAVIAEIKEKLDDCVKMTGTDLNA